MVLVLLDLWDVLLDSEKMAKAYPERLGRHLAERVGSAPDQWARAHRAAHAWYVDHMARASTWSGRPWPQVVNAADAEYVVRLFHAAGFPVPGDPLGTSRSLELEVMSSIDAAFPDARPTLARLKAAGHRVLVVTNATESNARGSLAGARLLDAIDWLFTGELLEGGKERPQYWERISDRLGTGRHPAVIVDDRLDYLEAAASVGFTALLLDRRERQPAGGLPPYVHASLRNLAGLPHFVSLLESGQAHTST